ncbi:BrnT family toxin [Sandarakinorhabdus glacialis]|nr:BrnT family toxin [Polymorphobacter glacialis]
MVVVVWTLRPGSRRIISMRKANAEEEARYRDALDRSG